MSDGEERTAKGAEDAEKSEGPSPKCRRILRALGGDAYILVGVTFLLFFLIWLSLLCTGRSAMLHDPGSFWHVVVGEKMLATERVPRDDSYSFTFAGRPWVADQWLAECGMAAVHRVAGWDGLLLLTATLLAGIYTWIGVRLLRSGLHLLPAGLLLALVIRAGSIQFHVRPLVISIGLLAVTFAWLVDVEAGRKPARQLGWLVPLLILWANLHGGVVAGLGTIGFCVVGWCLAWALARTFDYTGRSGHGVPLLGTSSAWSKLAGRHCLFQAVAHVDENSGLDSRDTPRVAADSPRSVPATWADCFLLAGLLVALAATTLVNPYGIELPRAWLKTLTMPLPNILQEHGPLSFTDPVGWATMLSAAGYLAVLIGVFPRRPRITWLVPLVWFVLALQRVRNVPLFAVVAVIGLADMLPFSRVGKWFERRELLGAPRPAIGWRAAVLPLVLVLAAAALQVAGVRVPVVGRGWARFDPTICPVQLLPKLAEINHASKDGTRIFNDLNFGGFLIYFTPRLRVFVDDRCSLYGGDFLAAYEHARRDAPAQIDPWRQLYGFRYALVETGGRFDRYLADAGSWFRLARTPAATLYQQRMGVSPPMQ